jgi:hypothetical protein
LSLKGNAFAMRIGKTIKGELYHFYVQFIPYEKKVKVRYFQSDEWTVCDLSDDFNYILLPEGKFRFNDTDVKKLKLNKTQRIHALDYNTPRS